ncbi:MAG TPA: hypothetical protein VGR68_14125 [Actinomycetota bacterium]|nr:hypothetical protein [Actinomycetota bacterium]
MTDSKGTPLDEAVSLIDKTREQTAAMVEKIFAAAQPGAVYGQPIASETYTVITAAEVTSGGGFGMGIGLGPPSRPGGTAAATADAAQPDDRQTGGGGGGGGGGGSMGRPVAVIAIGPDGVTVRPVVDVTKVALAGLTAWATMLAVLRARRRARRR